MHTYTHTYLSTTCNEHIGEKLRAVSVNAEQAAVHKAEPSTQATTRLNRPFNSAASPSWVVPNA